MMTVCIDFDGVLAATCAAKRAWIVSRLGLDVSSLRMTRTEVEPLVGKATYTLMQRELGYADTLDAEPLPGALETCKRLAQFATLHIVTARVPAKLMWVKSWLGRQGILGLFQGVHTSSSSSKSAIAHRLNATWLVDNDARHLVGLRPPVRGVYFGKTVGVPVGVIGVSDWSALEPLLLNRQTKRDEAYFQNQGSESNFPVIRS